MALQNRPLTAADMKMLLDSKFVFPLQSKFMRLLYEALENPTPHVVHYWGGRHTYTAPSQFYWTDGTTSPSDCEWHIPGSERKGF